MPLQLFPTEDELVSFEKNYAGADTEALEQRYLDACTIGGYPNTHCLICLGYLAPKPAANTPIHLCISCPRRVHSDCLTVTNEKLASANHCPLCCKRAWHVIVPTKPAYLHPDDLLMARTARKVTWEEQYGNDKDMNQWLKLKDDRALESDRRLLLDLGAVLVEELRAAEVVGSSDTIVVSDANNQALTPPDFVLSPPLTTQPNVHTDQAEEPPTKQGTAPLPKPT